LEECNRKYGFCRFSADMRSFVELYVALHSDLDTPQKKCFNFAYFFMYIIFFAIQASYKAFETSY